MHPHTRTHIYTVSSSRTVGGNVREGTIRTILWTSLSLSHLEARWPLVSVAETVGSQEGSRREMPDVLCRLWSRASPHPCTPLHIPQSTPCFSTALKVHTITLAGTCCRCLEFVSPDKEGNINADDQLLTRLEVGLVQDLRRTVGQLAATAWAQNNLPVPQVWIWGLPWWGGRGVSVERSHGFCWARAQACCCQA